MVNNCCKSRSEGGLLSVQRGQHCSTCIDESRTFHAQDSPREVVMPTMVHNWPKAKRCLDHQRKLNSNVNSCCLSVSRHRVGAHLPIFGNHNRDFCSVRVRPGSKAATGSRQSIHPVRERQRIVIIVMHDGYHTAFQHRDPRARKGQRRSGRP